MEQSRQIFKNTAVMAIARLTERVGGILLIFLVARILHANGLGVYAAAIATYDLIAIAGELGAKNLLIREISKDRSKTNSYFVHLAAMSAAVSALVMFGFWLVLPSLGYEPNLAKGLYIVILAIIPGTLSQLQEGVFVAHQRVEFVTYTTFITTLANLGICIFLLLNGHGIVGLLLTYVLIQYFTMFCYFLLMVRYVTPIHWIFDWSFTRTLLNEVKAFAGLALLGALFASPEVIILSLISNATQIGYYSAALKIINLWQYIPQIYMTNVFPVLSRSYHLATQQAQVIRNQSMKYLLAVALPLTVGLFVVADPAIDFLYGRGFNVSNIALRLLALNIPFAALFAVLWRVLMARGEQGLLLRIMIVVTVTEWVTGYLLISHWDTLGAAINVPMLSVFYVCLLLIFVRRDGQPIPLIQISWRFLLAALCMGAIIGIIYESIPFWALVLVAALSYTAFVILFKAFSSEEIALFRTLLRRDAASEEV